MRTSYDGRPTAATPKEVDYWTGQWVGGDFRPNDEVDELRWLPVEAAAALCSYAHDRAVLADLAPDRRPADAGAAAGPARPRR